MLSRAETFCGAPLSLIMKFRWTPRLLLCAHPETVITPWTPSFRSHDCPLTFTITAMLSGGSKKYSQVFSGRLEGTEEEVCLKLLDERYFPVPMYNVEDLPMCRLLRLNFCAEDMIRREEGVYEDRLKHLQGTLIPHCYGFHLSPAHMPHL